MKNFRQLFVCLACLSVLFSCTNQNRKEPSTFGDFADQSRKEKIARLNNSVFGISIHVKGKNIQGRYSVGTGFLIEENLIASALHVQTKAEELAKKFGNATCQVIGWKQSETGGYIEFPIEVAAADQESDLIIYRFDGKVLQQNSTFFRSKSLPLAENLPSIGAEAISIGYYGDYKFPFNSIGNVAMIDVNGDIFSDLTLMPGNSGAPVCDLETGAVLGVTTDVLDLGNETVRYGIAKRAAKLRALRSKF